MKEYLPIGTVVLLEEDGKPIMIYGRKQIHLETGEVYDYIACLYPEGNLSVDYTYLFNHDQIADVLHTGYVNEDEEKFLEVLEEARVVDEKDRVMAEQSFLNAEETGQREKNGSLFDT